MRSRSSHNKEYSMPASNPRPANSGVLSSAANSVAIKLILLVAVLGSLLLVVYVKGETANRVAATAGVPVHLTPQGKQLLNLQQPRQLNAEYRGDPNLVEALRSGAAHSMMLATADLNLDSAPDLITGYSFGQRGVVTVQRGNVDAFAPKKQEIFDNAAKGILPPSFVSTSDVFDLPA